MIALLKNPLGVWGVLVMFISDFGYIDIMFDFSGFSLFGVWERGIAAIVSLMNTDICPFGLLIILLRYMRPCSMNFEKKLLTE